MMYRIVLLLIIFSSSNLLAIEINNCIKLENDADRLSCYDKFHKFNDVMDEAPSKIFKRSPFSILPHKQSYFMPVSHNSNRINSNELLVGTTDNEIDDVEVKFQISFKLPLWDEVLGKNTQLMAGFTQQSFWQMYNSGSSSPFRETNYEPEIYLSKTSNIDVLGMNLVSSSLGFVHQSNGRSSTFSRSWNRIYTHFVFQKDEFFVSVKPWLRISESAEDDDNPDIGDYLGHYEIGMLYQFEHNEFTVMLRNLNSSKHHETYQLGWLFPVNDDVNFYLEYFHGYGESLIDYNHQSSTLSMGFSITDWVD